ncbi:flagellar basal-body rod protein FlgF [Halotalea alkalilenta]|uniref:Flagellar basal-body rod protein FlgF n=1 Tax=Halotalea alkalilenta TaxID=376489 RepID=A0A172YH15_9GAMM|nr:flagellar basal-body rod protein FlgF [Halotalea alkalilenta]ANF58372.1 flagellar biosynthesis protein FlgF [Halotalea alkalilenta]
MDRMIYTALSGAKQSLAQQSVASNNMANVSTTGFRAQLSAFRALPVRDEAGEGVSTRVATVMTTPGMKLEAGELRTTGRGLDIAIDGAGWLAVGREDGSEAYTRDGGLQLDDFGMLVTGSGRPVHGEDGNPLVIPPGSRVEIAADGTVSALGLGDPPATIAEVGRIKLVDPDPASLARGEDGLFALAANAQGEPQAAPLSETVRLVSGALEASNVSAVDAMMAMITNARRFELNMKAISTADDNANRANALLGPSNG